MKRNLRSLHSKVRVTLVCYRQIFLQQDLYPALSGREIIDAPPITKCERWDILRDPKPAGSTIPAVLDYQVIAAVHVGAVPRDLLDASCRPDFAAVRLQQGKRW